MASNAFASFTFLLRVGSFGPLLFLLSIRSIEVGWKYIWYRGEIWDRLLII